MLSFEQANLPRFPASQWLPAVLPPEMHAAARSPSWASGRDRAGLMPMVRAATAVRRLWSCILLLFAWFGISAGISSRCDEDGFDFRWGKLNGLWKSMTLIYWILMSMVTRRIRYFLAATGHFPQTEFKLDRATNRSAQIDMLLYPWSIPAPLLFLLGWTVATNANHSSVPSSRLSQSLKH